MTNKKIPHKCKRCKCDLFQEGYVYIEDKKGYYYLCYTCFMQHGRIKRNEKVKEYKSRIILLAR